jgi:hypothetical protein
MDSEQQTRPCHSRVLEWKTDGRNSLPALVSIRMITLNSVFWLPRQAGKAQEHIKQ